jgi:predicted permease
MNRYSRAVVLLTTLTLALGIGAASAVFSLAEAMLFRSGPFDDAHQLVRIFSTNPSQGMDQFNVSYPDFADFKSREDLFQRASLFTVAARDLSGEELPERVTATAVYGDFFQTLRVDALVGRVFVESDHDPATEPTVVLAEGLWRRRFGGSDVVGRVIRLDGVGHTVIGVVPEHTVWPQNAQLWIPLQWGGSAPGYADRRSNHAWGVFARLQPGIDAVTADGQVREMARRIYADPEDERDEGIEAQVIPLWRAEAGEESGGIFSVMGAAVLLVLLIACMNASGILLSHATSRVRELSIRSALGADRARLVLLLLVETGIVALLGGAAGVAGAVFGLRQLLRLVPAEVPSLLGVELNPPVVAAALGISLVSALVAGLVPAIHASRKSVTGGLKEGSHQATAGVGGQRFRKGLVVAELALSMMLLVAAGLTVRGFQRQLASDPGFESSGLLTFSVRLPASRYGEAAQIDQF